MAQLFIKGDIVKLKSGGPQMTIEKYKSMPGMYGHTVSDHVVVCSWFDNENKLIRNEFEQEALKKHEE